MGTSGRVPAAVLVSVVVVVAVLAAGVCGSALSGGPEDPLYEYVEHDRRRAVSFSAVVGQAQPLSPLSASGPLDGGELTLRSSVRAAGTGVGEETPTFHELEREDDDPLPELGRVRKRGFRISPRGAEGGDSSAGRTLKLPRSSSRVKVEQTYAYPNSAVVKIFFTLSGACADPASCDELKEARASCSGSVIDKYHVLTAAHCVFDPAQGGVNSQFFVVPGFTDALSPKTGSPLASATEKPFGVARGVRIGTFGYSVLASRAQQVAMDYALITLDRPLESTGQFRVSPDLREGGRVTKTGYAAVDYDGTLQQQNTGAVTAILQKVIFVMRCQVCQGDSGGPVYTGSKQRKLQGVVSSNVCPKDARQCCSSLGAVTKMNVERRKLIRQSIRRLTPKKPQRRPYVIWYTNPKEVSRKRMASLDGKRFRSGGRLGFKLSLVNRGVVFSRRIVVSFYYSFKRDFKDYTRMRKTFFDSVSFDSLKANTFGTFAGKLDMPKVGKGRRIFVVAVVKATRREYTKDVSAHIIYMGSVKSLGP